MLAGTLICAAVTGRAGDGPRDFTNLQVLPRDISTAELFENMKRLTRGLGVQCRYCHRTDIRDFATDEIERKRIARAMMLMTKRMNEELSAAGAGDAPKVTCFTCHRGKPSPADAGNAREDGS